MTLQPESTLAALIRYNNWANAQVLAACEKLDLSQLAAAAPGTYGTIRDTLGHVIRAEADYIGRMTGNRPQPAFKWEDEPPIAEMAAFAAEVATRMLDTIRRVPPEQNVHEEENGLTVDYLARGLYIQVINHGIEHRTNITTILSGLGLPAPEVDGWAYMWAFPEEYGVREGKVEEGKLGK